MPLIKKDNVNKFGKKLESFDPFTNLTYLDFSSLYPSVVHVASQTIGFDIVPTKAMVFPPNYNMYNIDINENGKL